MGRSRSQAGVAGCLLGGLSPEQLAGIEGVAMDMWGPYFESTMQHVPDAESKIVFDRFHVTAYLTKAVDLTRRAMMRDQTLDGRH